MKSATEQKIEHYRKELDAGNMMHRICGADHTCRHVKRTDVDLLERIFSEQKRCNSTFTDRESADIFIDETLYNKMPEIVNWLDNETTKQFAAVVQFTGEVTGKAIVQHRSDIKTYEYDSVTVVLGRNPYGYGFELITAYPSESIEKHKLNQNLMPALTQTPSYQKANPVEQTFMEYQIDNCPYQVNKFENYDGQTFLQMEVRDEEAKYLINVTSRIRQCGITKIPKDRAVKKQFFDFEDSEAAEYLTNRFPENMETMQELFDRIQKKLKGRSEKAKSIKERLIYQMESNGTQFE